MVVYLAQSPSGNVYVGITTRSLNARINDHKRTAKIGKQYKFSDAIRKYGIYNLSWFELNEVNTEEELYFWEKYYIKLFNSYKDGYNSTIGGEGALGRNTKHPGMSKWISENRDKFEESIVKQKEVKSSSRYKAKASYCRKQYLSKDENRINISRKLGGKPIGVYKEGKLVNVYVTLAECSRQMGIKSCYIYRVLNGKRSHHCGYTFERIA